MLQTYKAELFKALGHPARIRILELLRNGEQTVSELQEQVDAEMSAVSQQLAVLRNRQIVESRKEGTSNYYRVTDEQVFELLDVARAMFNRQLQALQAMAEADDAFQSELEERELSTPGEAQQGR